MEFKHNKKRNIGLISEFFSRYIGEAFLDGRHNDIKNAKELWNKHVHSKSEIYKELQVFNGLYESNLSSKELALSLLERTRNICKNQKQETLDREKEALITEIKSSLTDKDFFDKNVPDFKSYASIQVLMNAWRGTGFKGSFSDLISLEESVLSHLLKEKKNQFIDASNVTNDQVDTLVVKLMTEKFNARYAGFNQNQKYILSLYALSEKNTQQTEQLSNLLESLRLNTISLLKKPVMLEELNPALRKKMNEILGLLESDYSNTKKHSDDIITFYMTIAKLKEEIESKV